MREIRIYIESPLATGNELALPPEPAHHVARVLRLRAGQPLTLFNGHGGQYAATIQSISGRDVRVAVGEHQAIERESPLDITLVQAVSRGRHMDYTLQKAVELGVNRIVPVMSEFGQVKLEGKRLPNRLEHWRGIVIAACEQCGRNRLPPVDTPQPFGRRLETLPAGPVRLLLDPQSGQPLRDLSAPVAGIVILSGPEGGFSPDERQAALQAGCHAVGLGPRVLRTETAAPAAITACQALWGDLG
ncbi:MAG: 16S rRNA (uracil(1498)-N(3))-methyltransferase [Gammaproteobacteria bacterium]|nr:16S rRNA (uracil(1498)-N(3))-methyltransferase [Gammaproteobacteria bacterium]